MGRFSQKFQTFIFGLSVGLLIGCLFFIFKLDDFFGKVSLFDKEKKASITEEIVVPDKDQNKSDKKINPKSKTKTSEKKKEETQEENVSKKFNTVTPAEVNEENINVLKEELVGVKNITVKDIQRTSEYSSISDSVISTMSGVNPGKKNDFFMIEFWKTPLNSKGYKMTRNRVLIYGIKENADLVMVKLDDNYYLKNNSEVYRLNYSPEFKPMEKVNESTLLQKLNM